ncbi:iron uptake system protein EfeO [Actinoplanes sp. N902-109]|uniref:iron uptake system protein EfeO n=1 Tax=Actinoplanes sp. (strain N902-109) TaxID=649831 RepID=UPI0003293477|nr:iron uptake system protein EfeO [Actinoplanes sp. N902-109]AGL16987.1 peptidase M75, Imelysin [Actinoplanes sp. N902-109]
MNRALLRGLPVLLLAAGATAACASDKSDESASAAGATTVDVTLTDDGCTASPASIAAGPATFKIRNASATRVTEAELLREDTIMGEKENLTPGLTGSFSLKLDAGTYQLYCPNAKTEKSAFTVTGSAAAASADPAVAAALTEATKQYQAYVISEVAKLVPATKTFTDAVRAGDVAKAKASFAAARYHYEEIEPVAESFGDLDPGIDARVDDVDDENSWTGFHRLEKALWADKSVAGLKPVADKLDQDIAKLQKLVSTATFQPAQLANGATELLNEVASSKITGEEDRYSHTDLSDFEANVAGAQSAFKLLQPALQKLDPALATTVQQQFENVTAAVKPYKKGDGFVDYSTVTEEQRRELTQKVDALAEPLSQVAAKVTL